MRKKTVTLLIIVLSALLCLTISALTVVLVIKHTEPSQGSAVIPGNVIEPENVAHITVSGMNPIDRINFKTENMFPGDEVRKYYILTTRDAHVKEVRFRAEVIVGSGRLTEVLGVKVGIYGSDEVLYDGLMKDMPEYVTCKMPSDKQEIIYEVTAYLGTDVGNEYMLTAAEADFEWWVDQSGYTGTHLSDHEMCYIWCFGLCPFCPYIPIAVMIGVSSIIACTIRIVKRRREQGA